MNKLLKVLLFTCAIYCGQQETLDDSQGILDKTASNKKAKSTYKFYSKSMFNRFFLVLVILLSCVCAVGSQGILEKYFGCSNGMFRWHVQMAW